MLTTIFGKINSATQFLLGIYALLIGGVHFFLHPQVRFHVDSAFGELYIHPIIGYVLSIVFYFIVAFGYQWLWFTKHRLVKHHALIPFFLLPLIFLQSNDAAMVLLLHLALLLVIIKTWLDANQGDQLLRQSLNTGLLIGLGSLIELQYMLVLIFTWVVYIVYGRISFRTLLIPLIGYFNVWFVALILDYLLFDGTYVFEFFTQHFAYPFGWSLPNSGLVGLVTLGVLLIPSFREYVVTVSRAAVFKRQSYTLFLTLTILAMPAYFFAGNSDLHLALLICLTTILFVNFLQYVKRNWVKELVLWAMILLFGIFESGVL